MLNTTILNYKILSQIGEGGMGTVYLGTHQTLDRKVAIKMLLPELASNQQIKDRFINEAKTLSKLNQQNIVTLYDFASVDNNLFLIMEYVEGTPLDTVIEKITGPIPENRCIAIFDQILSGFAYAHKKGIVHRDIKPSNIILQSDDTPKILDFGIAKIVEGDMKLTKTGTRMGSVIYMSPEQVMGKEVDLRSDIYSLGVTLFEILSGRLPYNTTTESEFEIQTKIVREPLPSIRAYIPNISDKLDQIICRATAKEPEYRFQSCEEFKEAINFLAPVKMQTQGAGKTVIQQVPVNRTVFEQPVQQQTYVQPASKNKLIPFLFGGTALVVVILILFLVFNKGSDVIKTDVNTKNIVTPITEAEINKFLELWTSYQNNKSISQYLGLYSSDFQGIKRTKSGKASYMNYSEWSTDRAKMYETAVNLNISLYSISVKEINKENGIATVEFGQVYSSAKYTDDGQKTMKLRKDSSGNIKIIFEEMKYSVGIGE